MTEAEKKHRRIRSFVRRSGRVTEAQGQALDDVLPQVEIPYQPQLTDLSAFFDTPGDLVFDIGFGMGDSLLYGAKQFPDKNFIGVEVYRPGIGACLARMREAGLQNIRVMTHDAVEVLEHMVPPGSLSEVLLFFPDPWHKKRHHKRRIVNPAFAGLVARALKPGGLFHLATDWEHYAMQMLAVLSAAPEFENLAGAEAFHPRPDTRPLTKFEKRGQRLGHGVWDLLFRRR